MEAPKDWNLIIQSLNKIGEFHFSSSVLLASCFLCHTGKRKDYFVKGGSFPYADFFEFLFFLKWFNLSRSWQLWDQRFQVLPSLSQVDIKIPLWTKEFKNLSCSKPFSKKTFMKWISMARADQIKKTCEIFSECPVYCFYKNQNSF